MQNHFEIYKSKISLTIFCIHLFDVLQLILMLQLLLLFLGVVFLCLWAVVDLECQRV